MLCIFQINDEIINILKHDKLKFKELLESELGYDVVLEDERLTTKVAENILINADMSRKKRKKVIDKMAATVILQGYLDRL